VKTSQKLRQPLTGLQKNRRFSVGSTISASADCWRRSEAEQELTTSPTVPSVTLPQKTSANRPSLLSPNRTVTVEQSLPPKLRVGSPCPIPSRILLMQRCLGQDVKSRQRLSLRLVAGILFSLPLGAVWTATVAFAADDFEREPVNYSKATPENTVSRLQKQVESGQAHFEFDPQWGYLRSLLHALHIPESSQMLVFSKTSFQRQRIAPRTPRALYFNDDVYVGYCADGDIMEISAVDPQLGAVFYTLDQEQIDKPRITRQTESCLLCHANSQTRGVPGFVVRSVYVDAAGFPMLGSGTFHTDHASPFKERWGGWYVTGTHGKQKHLGNLIATEKQSPEETDNSRGMNVTDVASRFNRSKYLAGSSDIVALMVMEHQTTAHNLITAANFQTRLALAQEAALNRELKQPADYRWDSTNSRIKAVGEPLVRYLLFSEEAVLTDPIRGTTSFATDFAARGPRDKRGRSLRDFDLTRRLFKYPCSYLVYSPAFDSLPSEVKKYVSRRMDEILSRKDRSPEFASLSAADRQAIVEILKETKPSLAGSWKAAHRVAAN
jgi:hypothetical protein